jgi:hypothetical protein
MASISPSFRKFIPQLLHIFVLPIFYFAFILIYRPFDVISLMGADWFGVHITIIAAIILACILLTRLLYYFLPIKANYTLYSFWCLAEIIFTSFFAALYLWLVLDEFMPYFDVLTTLFKHLFFTLMIPYAVTALALRVYDYHKLSVNPEGVHNKRLRFYDEKHNLKLVVASESLLYISAEENYVNIYFLESGRVKNFVLRNTMKSLEELCADNRIIRCHRSYYVNPLHVKILRKDSSGVIFAELDSDDSRRIPVTKKYYGMLSELL